MARVAVIVAANYQHRQTLFHVSFLVCDWVYRLHLYLVLHHNNHNHNQATVSSAIEQPFSGVLSTIKIIQTDTVTCGLYQQLNNSYYSTLYITTILRVYVIYNIRNQHYYNSLSQVESQTDLSLMQQLLIEVVEF